MTSRAGDSQRPNRRVLFFAEAGTLAHVARPLALAATLQREQRFDVRIACAPDHAELIRSSGFDHASLYSIPSREFLSRLATGSPLYSAVTLERYVDDDLRTIAEYHPDVIVGDFRISLSVSARLSRIPYVSIANAYWSPYANLHFPVPEIPLVRFLGVRIAQRVFDVIRPIAFAYHSLPLNRVRLRHGLPTLDWDLCRVYTDADYTLYADLPDLVPIRGAPTNHSFIGPILWSYPVPEPSWWKDLSALRPLVYVALGSSGRSDLLPTVLAALSALPVEVIAATAGRVLIDRLTDNVRSAEFLPGDIATRRSSLVICNGGSLTTYQALASGVPVLGICSNMDQLLNMSVIEAANAGICLRGSMVSKASLTTAAEQLLGVAAYRTAAEWMRGLIESVSLAASFESVIDSI